MRIDVVIYTPMFRDDKIVIHPWPAFYTDNVEKAREWAGENANSRMYRIAEYVDFDVERNAYEYRYLEPYWHFGDYILIEAQEDGRYAQAFELLPSVLLELEDWQKIIADNVNFEIENDCATGWNFVLRRNSDLLARIRNLLG